MALKINASFTARGGIKIEVNDSYVKVTSIYGDKSRIVASVGFFKKKESADPFGEASYSFCPALDDENFIAQAYRHMKILPEFSGAIDC